MNNSTTIIKSIMQDYAYRTGLISNDIEPKRYLWTDAFAVSNLLQLYTSTGESQWLDLAFKLVDQTHLILGKYREDSNRQGWLSQLNQEQAIKHPTSGGLRIGKQSRERAANEPPNEDLEWDRDGQYFHYLTQWMRALECMSCVTKKPTHLLWAIELAQVAHNAFVYSANDDIKKMYWKMSIDLSRPVVHSMGHHDPLDGLVTFMQLDYYQQTSANDFDTIDLSGAIMDFEQMCHHISWRTHDSLGIGSLLILACHFIQLIVHDYAANQRILEKVMVAIKISLDSLSAQGYLLNSFEYRLPFRDFGLAIGLQAIDLILHSISKNQKKFNNHKHLLAIVEKLRQYKPEAEKIQTYWLQEQHHYNQNWQSHIDINSVMLATSLAPESYLRL